MSQPVTKPQKKTSRKVKALLAGGVVLGVGAAVTLAAWTDQEWAQGIFSTGSFNIESSADGDEFNDHESQDDAATLAFDLPGAADITPGETLAAPFVLRLAADSDYDAVVDLTTAAPAGDNVENLSYSITQVASVGDCVVEAEGDSIVSDNDLDSVSGADSFTLATGSGGEPGVPVTLCFEVTAADGLEQGQETTARWQFTGTSVE